MKGPLVSIITPCYNGEKFVGRFLESILNQTYTNIELIIVNDGSTDKTEEVILSYQPTLESKGIQFIYLFQENKGQAAALNLGLKIFKGEYLTWPDSDDILHEDYVTKKVNFLEKNEEIGLLISRCRILQEGSLNQIGTLEMKPFSNNLFYDFLVEKNVFFAPGGFMIRAKCFLESNPKRFIIESKAGQNWQMLLPIVYRCKYRHIDDYLYDYILRIDSHSRQDKLENEILTKYTNQEILLINIIKEMNIIDELYYLNIIKTMYVKKRLELSYKFNNKESFYKEYFSLKQNNLLNTKTLLLNLAMKYQFLKPFFKVSKGLIQKLRGLIK